MFDDLEINLYKNEWTTNYCDGTKYYNGNNKIHPVQVSSPITGNVNEHTEDAISLKARAKSCNDKNLQNNTVYIHCFTNSLTTKISFTGSVLYIENILKPHCIYSVS